MFPSFLSCPTAYITPSGVALAWPLDKYEALTVDTTRVAETRKWGREPREGSEEGAAKQPTGTSTTPTTGNAEATGSSGVVKQSTAIGVKRPRETNWTTDMNKGEQEPENPWQVQHGGAVDFMLMSVFVVCLQRFVGHV